MRNPILPPLLRILDPLEALLPRLHRGMLHMHAEDGKRLPDGVDRVSQERRPRRQQVRVRRGVLEVRGEGESRQRGEDALNATVISHCRYCLQPT